jgi:hypothetical protein
MTTKHPMEFHGVLLSGDDTDEERTTTCWECGKENHLFINSKTFQWDCKVCGASGNIYTFLNRLIGDSMLKTSIGDYAKLSKVKNIPIPALREAGVVLSCLSPENWLLPSYNQNGKLNNVYLWNSSNNVIYVTPSLNQSLYFRDKIHGFDTIMICEGHWDGILWRYLMKGLPVDVVASPGATTFPKTSAEVLGGKNVWLPYDNDLAGRRGVDRVAKMALAQTPKAKSIKHIAWSSELPEGYDMRDLFITLEKKPDVSRGWLNANLVDWHELEPKKDSKETATEKVEDAIEKTGGIDPIPCESFDDLCEIMESLGYRMFPAYREALATMLAVVISPALLGPMLWIYVVGPSGIGKTMLCDMLAGATKYVRSVSKMHGMLSGWSDGTGKDNSLLPLVDGLCMVVKDLTAILTLSEQLREKLFGELRDIYDGYASAHYLNGVSVEYKDVNFGFIAGVTDVIKVFNNTDVGERFLHIDMESGFTIGESDKKDLAENRATILKAIVMSERDIGVRKKGQKGKDEDKDLAKAYTYGFIEHMMNRLDNGFSPKLPPEMLSKIGDLATLIAATRTKVKRTHQGELAYKPRQESAFRTARQLKKMAYGLSIVLQLDVANDTIWRLVKRVGLETAAGSAQYEFSLVKLLSESRLKMSCQELSEAIGLSDVATRRYLNNLKELDTVTTQTFPNGAGQRVQKWGLSDDVKISWKAIFNEPI